MDNHLAANNQTFKEYIQKMRLPGEYADHLMLFAAARYTGFIIEVISNCEGKNKYSISPPGSCQDAPHVQIGHISEFHFVALE
jgi:hypothetical protein